MAVDTSIQFNSYNSYRFNTGEVLHCYPFGVEGMGYITHSFAAYTPLALASAVRATTTFFDIDSEIISSVDHSFDTPQGTFEQRTITVPVPALAVKAQLTYKNSAADPWWVATPKTEEGQTATPYAVNTYGQMTYITPNGIYTGTLTANQIVLASGNETLGDRLTTINSNQISLSQDLSDAESNISNVTSRVTTIEAGQITLVSRVDGVEPKVTKITSEGIYTGTIQASQINANTLSAITADLGTVNAGTINGVTINGSAFSGGTISLGGTNAFFPLQIESEDSDNYKVSIGPTRIQMYGQDGTSLKLFCSTFFDGTVMILCNEVDSSYNVSMNAVNGSVVAKLLQSEGLSLKFGSTQYTITRDSNGYLRAL
jgi:hypothetical protein